TDKILSGRICPEFQLTGKKQFHGNDEQHTDTSGSKYFNDKIEKTSKTQPLQKDHIAMMKQGKHQYIYKVRCPLHSLGRRFPVVELGCIFWSKDTDQKRTDICNKQTGSSM